MSTECRRDARGKLAPRLIVTILRRNEARVAAGATAAHNRDAVHWIVVLEKPRHNRVASLVIGGQLTLGFGHESAIGRRTGENAIDRLFDVAGANRDAASPRGHDRRLVEDARKVCAREAGCRPRQCRQVYARLNWLATCVDLQDCLAPAHVWRRDLYLAVEATGTQERLVQYVRSVGRRDHDDVGRGVEAVHFD